MTDFFISV